MSKNRRTRRLLAAGGLAVTNTVIGAGLLLLLSEQLRSRHLDGVEAVGMGQGVSATRGLGAGSDALDEAIETWTAWEQAHPGHAGWQEVAHVWLAVDTVVFTLAGYGLFFLVMALLARGPDSCVAPTTWRAVFLATGGAGVALALVDVVETATGHLVVASGGDLAAGALSSIRTFKWIVAALIPVVFVVGWIVVGVWWVIRSLRGA